MELYFKTADGNVGVVRNVPATGGGMRRAREAMRTCRYTEIKADEYWRLKREIDGRKKPEAQ